MSTEVDFKALWNKEEAKDIPDIRGLLEMAAALKRKTRNKFIGFNLLLIATETTFSPDARRLLQ